MTCRFLPHQLGSLVHSQSCQPNLDIHGQGASSHSFFPHTAQRPSSIPSAGQSPASRNHNTTAGHYHSFLSGPQTNRAKQNKTRDRGKRDGGKQSRVQTNLLFPTRVSREQQHQNDINYQRRVCGPSTSTNTRLDLITRSIAGAEIRKRATQPESERRYGVNQ